MNFQQVINSLGQMDGEYQKKTEMIVTIAEPPEKVRYNKNGVPGQNITFKDETGTLQKVKWLGQKGKDFEGLGTHTVGFAYRIKAWPFYVNEAEKTFLYCWIDSVISQGSPQTPQNAPQSTNYNQGISNTPDISNFAERLVSAIENLVDMKLDERFEDKYNLNQDQDFPNEPSNSPDSDIPF